MVFRNVNLYSLSASFKFVLRFLLQDFPAPVGKKKKSRKPTAADEEVRKFLLFFYTLVNGIRVTHSKRIKRVYIVVKACHLCCSLM